MQCLNFIFLENRPLFNAVKSYWSELSDSSTVKKKIIMKNVHYFDGIDGIKLSGVGIQEHALSKSEQEQVL